MRFSEQDVLQFADWSGDRNPLHVDAEYAHRTHFGQPLVHGMLAAGVVLGEAEHLGATPAQKLDIEFRGAILAGNGYDVVCEPTGNGLSVSARAGDTTVLTMQISGEVSELSTDLAWVSSATSRVRGTAAPLDLRDLYPGRQVTGIYEHASGELLPSFARSNQTHARVLALCSYVVGMELPGLRALFTRATVSILNGIHPGSPLAFRATVIRSDSQFRIVDLRLDVATADGQPVATADLRAYVRFTPSGIDLGPLSGALSPNGGFAGKVALVCGGARGLGGDITAALALSGCRVYSTYRHDGDAAIALGRAIVDHGGAPVDFLEGDVGDPAWCESSRRRIEEAHGRLDILVLNACAPPAPTLITASNVSAFSDYVARNLALVQAPIAAFLPLLNKSGGTLVAISSSFVSERPLRFGHYIALKQAVEATVLAAGAEAPGVKTLIARPPRLLTAWNDTPAGVAGAIPPSTAAIHIVRSAATQSSDSIVLSDFPALQEAVATVAPAEFSLVLSASFTAEPLVPAIEFWFRELSVSGHVVVAPYGQVMQTLLAPPDINTRSGIYVYLLRVADWIRELEPERATSPQSLGRFLTAAVEDLERAVRGHRAQVKRDTVLVLCPSETGREDQDLNSLIASTQRDIRTRFAGIPGLTVVDAEDWHDAYAVAQGTIADPIRNKIAHIPFRPAYFHTLAAIVMRHVHRGLAPARKVVVVDCDNTLWQGVVGEVGADGVRFESSHLALHERLAALAENGMLIALCSKNEEEDVWRVFDTRPELRLRKNHVICAMVNWQLKSQNVKAIAARLNLGLDSFVFIDDNPIECAEVRAACPEVLTIEWPHDVDRARRLLQHFWELDARPATAEDQRRTDLYKEEFRRQELQAQALTFREFIAGLDLSVDVSPLTPEDLKRAAQLTLRTNQFNFTTRRRSEAELQSLASTSDHEIRTVRVKDRFGDYGLVGLLIARASDGQVVADTFLLSCRVLGRGVEYHMVNELGRIATARGATSVRLRVEPTKRNTPARTFLETLAPAPALSVADGVMEAVVPADWATQVIFEPSEQDRPPETPEQPARQTEATDTASLRTREQQIEKTAYLLGTAGQLASASHGMPVRAGRAHQRPQNVADFVAETFASVLGLEAARVRQADRLESLGCDSFRIVEITVALLEQFPWLPPTLLFEHRSVSEIVARISELADREHAGTEPRTIHLKTSPPARQPEDDIAIVGLHLRCAGADSPAELWELLARGGVAVKPVPPDRPAFFGTLRDDRPHYAALLEEVDRFEPELFGITPREAVLMDPQLRLFLEVARAALEDAGALGAGWDPDTGVFAGVMYSDYAHRANFVARHEDNPFKSWEGFSLANRLSQIFAFRGPSVAVDTACSSSGMAIHLACRALRAGDCHAAVVGGVNLILDPDRFVQLGRLGILSPSGRCLAFGAEADGTVLGEGAGVVVLRLLSAALRRRDHIYGVIKSTGVSTGSGTVGFTAPNPQAQAEATRRAVQAALIDPRTISYVETHGTATALGDPIEVRGLVLAYNDRRLWDETLHVEQRCAIGSIKPNIGHLEAGAGVLGLIKVLLQLQHGKLLPSVTSEQPNPHIAFAQTPFRIQRTLTPWSPPEINVAGRLETAPRRAALNSFGVGGANVHMIIEEAPPTAREQVPAERAEHLLTLSARTGESLETLITATARAVPSNPSSLADICFSANAGRQHLAHRVAIRAESKEQVTAALEMLAANEQPSGTFRGTVGTSGAAPGVAFLFTGQGSQYPGMGRELYESHPVFRDAMDRCFARFDRQLERSLRTIMFAAGGTPEAELLHQTGYTQPALFTLGYSLAHLWQTWGVKPDVVLGHSVGEITAMCVAGGLSLDEAVTLIAARGRLMQRLPAGGAMTSVMTDEGRVLQAIAGYEDRVSVAAINGPTQVVISGEGAAVACIAAQLGSEGLRTHDLVVSHAFHSPLMRPMLAEYEAVARRLQFTEPTVAFVSCVLGRPVATELLDPTYWVRNVIDPVRFTDGITALDSTGSRMLIELGPQPILCGLGRQALPGDEDIARVWLPSMRRDAPALRTLLSSLGELYVNGGQIDWLAFDEPWRRKRVSLPVYPFSRSSFWIDRSAVESRAVQSIQAPTPSSEASVYSLEWREQPSPRSPNAADALAGRNYVVIADTHDSYANAVTRALMAADAKVTRLSDVAALNEHHVRSAVGVLYVPPSTAPEDTDADPAQFAIQLCEQAAALMRVLIAEHSAARLSILTRNAVAPHQPAPSVLDVPHAALWGAARTFALEHPDQWGALIDVDSCGGRELAATVVNELAARPDEDQVVFRGDRRFVARLAPDSPRASGDCLVASGRTYVVTGGLGALGLHVARWLARSGATHLLLTSRRGLDTPGAESAVRSLEAAGARVRVLQADTSRREDVDAILTAVDPAAPLAGVFHAAGVDEISAIDALRPGDIPRVMGGKAAGAWRLHELTRELPLDWFVVFSSIASVLGSAQRMPYAAANAFLDGLVHERRRQGLPALSVNWGPWSGGGMATPSAVELYARAGNRPVTPDDGIRLLARLLAADVTQAAVVNVDWATFRRAYEARRVRPLISELTPPRRERAAAPPGTGHPWVALLSRTPDDSRTETLVKLLRAEIAETLGISAAENIPVDRPFRDMGMDSLMSADFARRLEKRVGLRGTSGIFDHPTVAQLARHLSTVTAPALREQNVTPEALGRAPATAIRSGQPVEEHEAITFQMNAFPNRTPELVAPRWRWMFVESAKRLGVPPRVWLHRQDGAVVGHNGAIPIRVKINGAERHSAWLVDTMVLERYRSEGVGARLMMRAHEDLPFALSLGQTEQMRAIQMRLGWEEVAPLQTAQLLIRPDRVLQGKIPAPLARAAGLGFRASSFVQDHRRMLGSLQVREVGRFDASHDALWSAMAEGLTCAVRRDASYLNWKYVDQPGQQFMRLELLDRGAPAGVIVCMLREPDSSYRYRRGFIVDVVAPLSDTRLLQGLIGAGVRACEQRGADAVLCLHVGSTLTQALRTCRFRLRKPERYLLVRPGDLTDDQRATVLSAGNWFVTQGDSDIDRPW